jgi:hypothetical protein
MKIQIEKTESGTYNFLLTTDTDITLPQGAILASGYNLEDLSQDITEAFKLAMQK